MPLISTLGAASSRGFGQFGGKAEGKYIEDYFSTYLYSETGDSLGEYALINNNMPLADNNAAWKTTLLQNGTASSGYGITVDSNGDIYVVGRYSSTLGFIAKYNSSFSLQWQRRISGTTVNYYEDVAVSSSGNVYAAGQIYSSGSAVPLLVKYNSSGVLQWQIRTDALNSPVAFYSIAVDSSENIYATGDDGYFMKFDSSGALVWQRRLIDSSVSRKISSVVVDSSGNPYVVGTLSTSTSTSSRYVVVAKYNSSGTIQWKRKVLDTASNQNDGRKIVIDSQNNIYVASSLSDATRTYRSVIKYNSSGTLQWQRKIYSTGSTNAPPALSIDSSDNIYISAAEYNADDGSFAFIAKYNSSGTFQWSQRLTSKFIPASSPIVSPYDLATSSGGDLYLTGDASTLFNTTLSVGACFITTLKSDKSTSSGTTYLSLLDVTLTDAAGTATDSDATTASDSAGIATVATSTVTDSAGVLTSSTLTQDIVEKKDGLVWIKSRSAASQNHALYDTVRGATNQVSSNLTNGQSVVAAGLNQFSATGFFVGNNTAVTPNGQALSSWTFMATPKFFDIVTYTGNGANRTISHSLGSVPGMILIKRTDTTSTWAVYHRSLATTQYLALNTTGATASGANYWNDTAPTATEFSLGTSTNVNANTGTYVAYLFAHDAGGFGDDGSQSVVSCDGFTTDGSGNGSVTLGYEPQFVLWKSRLVTGNWFITDNVRGASVASTVRLFPNLADAESNPGVPIVVPTATGFTLSNNPNSTAYVYMAIRRGPMATPTDATKVFMPTVYTGTNVDNRLVNTTIAPDMVFVRQRNDTVLGGMVVGDRMRGQPYLLTGTTAAEVTAADAFDQQIVSGTEYGNAFSSMNGFWCGNNATSKLNTNTTANNHIAEAFKRAPGFFDIVTYTGTGVARTIPHNLGVVPELMIVKGRSIDRGWFVYSASVGATKKARLETDDAFSNDSTWNNTAPTANVFSTNGDFDTNGSGYNYVAYLFASCPGVSKVGSYTGSGTTKQIDCGFTAGSRFILIKRTDSTGDWYVWDSSRGIVSGNDPYLRLNSNAVEVTNTDYVDTYAAGFEISSTAPAAINANGGTFIFLAIA